MELTPTAELANLLFKAAVAGGSSLKVRPARDEHAAGRRVESDGEDHQEDAKRDGVAVKFRRVGAAAEAGVVGVPSSNSHRKSLPANSLIIKAWKA